MKIRTSFPHFLKAALGLVLIHVLTSNAFAQTTISKPGNAEYYEYDNASWVHIHNITNTYDSVGQLTMELNTAPVTNLNLTKSETTRTTSANSKTSTTTYYSWQNNAWVITNMSGGIRNYNAANQLTEDIILFYKNGALTNSRKKSFIYDAAGNVIEEIEHVWVNNAWQNFYRYTFTYVQGIRTERLIYTYNTTTASWTLGGKHIYSGWHIPNQEPLVTEMQNKDASGNWNSYRRNTYSPGANGGNTYLTESYVNNSWVNEMRSTVIRDTQGNRTDQFMEMYVNGAWQISINSKFLNTYSPQNDLQQLIIQGQDSASAPLKNEQKFVYSNFQYFNRSGLGVKENQDLKPVASIYPNPATDKVQIKLSDDKPQALTATVSDITGKIWLTQTFKASEEKHLKIETLPKGVYMLQLQTETGSTVKRIVKQ